MSLKRTLAMGQVAGGNHLTADSDEPERQQPAVDAFTAADLAEDVNKAARRHAVNDRAAMDLQINGPGSRP